MEIMIISTNFILISTTEYERNTKKVNFSNIWSQNEGNKHKRAAQNVTSIRDKFGKIHFYSICFVNTEIYLLRYCFK